MKAVFRLALPALLVINSASLTAQEIGEYNNQQMATNSENLVKYLVNLGAYLGYNLPTQPDQEPYSQLFNPGYGVLAQYNLFSALGAIPVSAVSQSLSQFVPASIQMYAPLNALANLTFASQPFNNAGGQMQGKISVNQQIDQKNFQQDPVSQAVLNILSTPDSSYCMSYDGSSLTPNCQLLSQNKVLMNILGNIPGTYDYFSYDYNQQFLNQLSGDSLIAPLMYSLDNPNANTTSSGSPNQQNQGLQAQNQAQAAANFIRYASGIIQPTSMPKLKDYDTLYQQAMNLDKSVNPVVQQQAQTTLANYFTNLRSYAAQTSVGLSNLYYILSKRMPQNLPQTQAQGVLNPSSQALNEFMMATWRIYNPSQPGNKQWINQINTASPATVQKEIAILLAEMNYQLYLNRLQDERLLMTNSLLLLQNAKGLQPTGDLSNNSN